MGKKYIVEYEREGCIGAAACVAVQPEAWEIVDDGKADLKNPDSKNEIWRKEIDESESTCSLPHFGHFFFIVFSSRFPCQLYVLH